LPGNDDGSRLLRLNLGCGAKRLAGHVNVDKFGDPEVKLDLEIFPWPWGTSSVSEIQLVHVLEHLGHDPNVYLRIIQEMYRVCTPGARIKIVVPHHRHEFFFSDPTHVRAITPLGLSLFSKRANREWVASGASNSPLGLYLDVDFEIDRTDWKPSADWFRLHPSRDVDVEHLLREAAIYNNLIEEIQILLRVVK
jgi:hypothetical protein